MHIFNVLVYLAFLRHLRWIRCYRRIQIIWKVRSLFCNLNILYWLVNTIFLFQRFHTYNRVDSLWRLETSNRIFLIRYIAVLHWLFFLSMISLSFTLRVIYHHVRDHLGILTIKLRALLRQLMMVLSFVIRALNWWRWCKSLMRGFRIWLFLLIFEFSWNLRNFS